MRIRVSDMTLSVFDAHETRMSKIHTLAGTEINAQEFASWNERMFACYGNNRLYYHSNLIIRRIQARRIHTVLSFMRVKASDVVLDAGCGEGYLFSQLPPCRRRVGVDLSTSALDIARARDSGASWIQADLENLPFHISTFDKVCCSEVIEHVLSPLRVIEELHRVVKPSGTVVFTVPNERSMNRIKDLVLSNSFGRMVFPDIPRRTEWHLTEYTPALLRSQVKASFQILRERTLPMSVFGLGYGILCAPKKQPRESRGNPIDRS